MSTCSRQTQLQQQAEPILGDLSLFMGMHLRLAAAMSFIQKVLDTVVATTFKLLQPVVSDSGAKLSSQAEV